MKRYYFLMMLIIDACDSRAVLRSASLNCVGDDVGANIIEFESRGFYMLLRL